MSDGWGAVIAGLASIYTQKKKKDAAKDQYEFQQSELERRNAYNQQIYEQKQNSPQAKASKYLLAYYMPQMIEKMKSRNKGGDTTMLDRMLADIMGGLDLDGSSGSGGSSSPFSSGSMAQVGGTRKAGVNMQQREAARKAGDYAMVMGKIDPEAEGYNGKTWESKNQPLTLDGSPTSGGGDVWGTSAQMVGGLREGTHGMGNTTTQTERGYTVKDMPWNMIDEGADQAFPNQQGELATGGTLNVATDGIDPSKLLSIGSMLGITSGPKGTTMNANGTYGDGKFQMSDIVAWAKQNPVIWSILKGIGNVVLPGAATVGNAALNFAVNRGVGDGIPNNASIHRITQ